MLLFTVAHQLLFLKFREQCVQGAKTEGFSMHPIALLMEALESSDLDQRAPNVTLSACGGRVTVPAH